MNEQMIYFNQERRHSALGYRLPLTYIRQEVGVESFKKRAHLCKDGGELGNFEDDCIIKYLDNYHRERGGSDDVKLLKAFPF